MNIESEQKKRKEYQDQSSWIEDTLFARMHGRLYCESGFWGK